jgi:hypothetical protein
MLQGFQVLGLSLWCRDLRPGTCPHGLGTPSPVTVLVVQVLPVLGLSLWWRDWSPGLSSLIRDSQSWGSTCGARGRGCPCGVGALSLGVVLVVQEARGCPCDIGTPSPGTIPVI